MLGCALVVFGTPLGLVLKKKNEVLLRFSKIIEATVLTLSVPVALGYGGGRGNPFDHLRNQIPAFL